MMIRPGSVMTVRPPSWTLAALAAEVVEASRSRTAAHPARSALIAPAAGGGRRQRCGDLRRAAGKPVRRSAARSVPGREAARRSARPARRSAPRERRAPERRVRPPAALRPERCGTPPALGAAGGGAPGRPALAAWLSGRPHSEASSVRRDAAAPSCCRQVAGRRSAALLDRRGGRRRRRRRRGRRRRGRRRGVLPSAAGWRRRRWWRASVRPAAGAAGAAAGGGGGGGVGREGAAAGGGGGGVGAAARPRRRRRWRCRPRRRSRRRRRRRRLDAAAEPQQAAAAAALDAAAEPQQAAVAAVPDAAAERRPEAAAVRRCRCGGRRRRGLRRRLPGFPSGPASSLACATTSGAVCACDAEVANCVAVKSSRGEQQDAKVCHDVLGPRNRPDSNGTAFIGMSVGRLNG